VIFQAMRKLVPDSTSCSGSDFPYFSIAASVNGLRLNCARAAAQSKRTRDASAGGR
jgi:hypothetical protein